MTNNPTVGLSISTAPVLGLFDWERRVMYELLSKIEPPDVIGLVSVVGAFACGIVAIVMGVGLAIRRLELAAGLKKDMLERGMSAEEIRIVMDAGSKNSRLPSKGAAYAEL